MTRFWISLCALLFPASAHAYIGLGPGLAMLGPFLMLVLTVFLALLMIAAYPLRLLMKRIRSQKKTGG